MAKIARYTGNLQAFASGATGTERTVFGDVTQSDALDANINADFLVGWENGVDVNGFPPQQFFNAVGFTATQLIAYLHQMGIAEYDSDQEYHTDSICTYSNAVYKSLTNTNVGNTPDVSPANWINITSAVGITFDDSGVSITATEVQTAIEQLDLAVSAIDPVTINTISGLVISNNSTDALNDIDISVGSARDTTDTYNLSLASVFTKQIDATWAAGTNAGGSFPGTVVANTTYHVFLIRKDSDGSIDAGFDTSVTAANIPTGYTAYRRIGSFVTNATANIPAIETIETDGGGLLTIYKTMIQDEANTATGTSRNTATLSVPQGIKTLAQVTMMARYKAGTASVWAQSTSYTDTAASITNRDNLSVLSTDLYQHIDKNILTDTSGQIAYRSNADTEVYINTKAYLDYRRD